MKMKTHKGKAFVALFLIILGIMSAVPVQAEPVAAQQEIRVGLTSLYSVWYVNFFLSKKTAWNCP